MKKPFPVSFVLASLLSTGALCQSKHAVIDHYFRAIGGKERWLAVLTKVDSSVYVEFSGGKARSDSTFLVTTFMRPNMQKVMSYEKGILRTTLCFDGRVFWTQSTGSKTVQPEEDASYFKSTIMLGQADMLLDESAHVVYKGSGELDGKQFEVLEMKRVEWSSSYLYYFDKESGLLHGTVAHEAQNHRRTYFKEYRPVSGILVPFIEETSINGVLQDRASRLKIKFDEPVNPDVFQPYD